MKFLFLYHDSDENLVFRRTRKIPLNLFLVVKIARIIEIFSVRRAFLHTRTAFYTDAVYG